MNEDKKSTTPSKADDQKNSASVKNIQTAPVLKTHEIFSYQGEKKKSKDN